MVQKRNYMNKNESNGQQCQFSSLNIKSNIQRDLNLRPLIQESTPQPLWVF